MPDVVTVLVAPGCPNINVLIVRPDLDGVFCMLAITCTSSTVSSPLLLSVSLWLNYIKYKFSRLFHQLSMNTDLLEQIHGLTRDHLEVAYLSSKSGSSRSDSLLLSTYNLLLPELKQ